MTEQELLQIKQREAERVADAGVLAALLVPQLTVALARGAGPTPEPIPRFAAETSAPAREFTTPTDNFSADASSASPREPSMAGSPAIPDLLDAMLAAERRGRRATTNQRQ
ncbi:MAG: hypothetical protein NVV74_10755 [Magnetospirillum sp.]|nr:hypothetical protein [Magnetospirillum sp.]